MQYSTYFVTARVAGHRGRPFEVDRRHGEAETPVKSAVLWSADILEEVIWFGYEKRYILDAYVIMPDHIHLLLKPLPGWPLARILHGIKGYSAREINRLLGEKGTFWQAENFDHLIRDMNDWVDKYEYIHDNPVAAGLATKPQDYPYSSLVTMYSKDRLKSFPKTVL